MSDKKWYSAVLDFGTHTIVASLIFIVIAIPAIGLSIAVSKLTAIGVSELTVAIISILEYSLLILDSIVFIGYLIIESFKFLKEVSK